MSKRDSDTDDLTTYRGFAPATIKAPSGRRRGEPSTEASTARTTVGRHRAEG